MSFWTKEKTQTLKDLWVNHNYSAGQIGKMIGASRNSVIGKSNRLGLMKKRFPIIPAMIKSAKIKTINKKILLDKVNIESFNDINAPCKQVEPKIKYITDLKSGQCKWPMDDDTWCGCSTIAFDKSYCKHHNDIAYIKKEKK